MMKKTSRFSVREVSASGYGYANVVNVCTEEDLGFRQLRALTPGAAAVGHGHGELHGGYEGAGQQARDGLGAEEDAHDEGRAEDQDAGGHHLGERGLGGGGGREG